MTVTRQFNLFVAGTTLSIPCFFPSVSSVKTNLMPIDYIDLLEAAKHPLFLVSAFDIANSGPEHKERIESALNRSKQRSSVILMDSGNYEGFWKGDLDWTVDKFHSICHTYEHNLCFCYDNQEPPETVEAIAQDVERSVLRNQEHAIGTVVPIVHGPTEALPAAVKMVAEQLCPVLIAVPERALGEGIVERTRSVQRIRNALDELNFYCPLHLLGTGNPISIVAYAMAGADSFDGLEWCQTVVDHEIGMLLHFQQWDFVKGQTQWGTNGVLPFIQSALMHNLDFYRQFMEDLRTALIDNIPQKILERYTSEKRVKMIISAIKGGK